MTDTWDDDDRAIARALGADAPDADATGTRVDAGAVADYEAVLAHLPFDAVEPDPALEDRVVAAALARRPAATVAIDAGPRSRSARRAVSWRWIGAGAAGVAAAGIVVVLSFGSPSSVTGSPGARIQPAEAGESVARVLAEPGAQSGVLRSSSGATEGRVAFGSSGQGYLYDLARPRAAGTRWLWLQTSNGPVRVGALPRASTVHFFARGRLGAVTGVLVTSEKPGSAPRAPGPTVGIVTFDGP